MGLHYLHHNDIIHRDIKPDNILLFFDLKVGVQAKIADFSISRFLPNTKSDKVLTGGMVSSVYRPPELYEGVERYDTKVDIWSLGCVLMEMITGEYTFWDGNPSNIYSLITQNISHTSPNQIQVRNFLPVSFMNHAPRKALYDIIAILKGCLNLDPVIRWSCETILKSNWISECQITKQIPLERKILYPRTSIFASLLSPALLKERDEILNQVIQTCVHFHTKDEIYQLTFANADALLIDKFFFEKDRFEHWKRLVWGCLLISSKILENMITIPDLSFEIGIEEKRLEKLEREVLFRLKFHCLRPIRDYIITDE